MFRLSFMQVNLVFRTSGLAGGVAIQVGRRRQIVVKNGTARFRAPVHWYRQIWNMSPGDKAKLEASSKIEATLNDNEDQKSKEEKSKSTDSLLSDMFFYAGNGTAFDK